MKTKIILYLSLAILIIAQFSCSKGTRNTVKVNYNVHTFYYAWYGNPEIDGEYSHWNHGVIPYRMDTRWNNEPPFPGGENIGANYYPLLGNYSSNDPQIIQKHMEMIRNAGIGVVVISWWGPDDFARESIPVYLDMADKYGLKIAFHIEPVFKSAERFREIISDLTGQFGENPALYRFNGKPMYYIYDSYKVPAPEWKRILDPDSDESIRGTDLDGYFIGIMTIKTSREFFLESGFDGFYTYTANIKSMWASNPDNWPEMAEFARKNDLIFIPSVGPGYIDSRIRPWNAGKTVLREDGKYYVDMFRNALKINPDFISITSFNEWHEGTQIEPAIPKSIPGYTYEDYGNNVDPLFYIWKTRGLIDEYSSSINH